GRRRTQRSTIDAGGEARRRNDRETRRSERELCADDRKRRSRAAALIRTSADVSNDRERGDAGRHHPQGNVDGVVARRVRNARIKKKRTRRAEHKRRQRVERNRKWPRRVRVPKA